ncbi:multiubiquitin domain-containing protein [Psychrosphaera sp. 1_MG-2023]|uniref:multiubiquitin domain-containing protein n=1 Tax=Psychrosphaera sp. 1_MG-2023 TaxID=3062643 RepID=UPI0026E38FD6|nr:multiubiquitin domain-containing protein [Psychrosphaera sp. 1_MG-2023]MDO6719711.1 multiubiquitin domain-containing protein [Psychrosphaera sp. 1_MG-2023]
MKNFDVKVIINDLELGIEQGLYTGFQLLTLAGLSEDKVLVLERPNDVDTPVSNSDLVLIQGGELFSVSANVKEHSPNSVNPIDININAKKVETVHNTKLTGKDIKLLVTDSPENKSLYLELNKRPDHLVENNETILLNGPLRFLLVDRTNEASDIPDVEECTRNELTIPKKDKYRIKVDKEKFIVERPRLTGGEILKLAGYDSSRYLYQKFKNGERKQIDIDEKVDFSEPGIERFHTIRCEHQEGLVDARADFMLSESDSQFLDSLGLKWECVIERNIKRVVIYDFQLPNGFNVKKVDMNFRIPDTYPTSQIDMAYFYPAISRADGKTIRALSSDLFNGLNWQRWSRHRTAQNSWEPGVDSIATHTAYVHSWFIAELNK